MKDFTRESDARIVIDEQLRQAGWDPADKSMVLTEVPVTSLRGAEASAEGKHLGGASTTADGDEIPTGRADYVLQGQNGHPLAVIEAKRSAFHPYAAKQQALQYAKWIGAPFIFLTKELAPGQRVGPGKAIVFAITKRHAARLAQYLNDLHPEHKGHYAEVITSDVADAEEMIRKFKREDYPQVAVSVGMLDTGFDFREVLHLVMCRRVHSPILYQQMRGRGTRTAPHIEKQKFVIYDFFRNHEYFNDSETDIFTDTGGGRAPGGTTTPPKPPRDLIELGLEDEWLEAVTYVEVGPEGERIDKQDYITNWERTIRSSADDDPILQKVRTGNSLTPDEEQTLSERLNNPKYYFNEENLRRAYRRPGGTLLDFIRAVLGSFKLKSREEELTEDFQAWLVSKNLGPDQAQYLALLKNRGIVRGKVEVADLFQPPLSILNAAGLGVELFGERGLKEIIEDLNKSVFLPRTA